MQKKFLCVLAILAIVAAMTFGKADACNNCGCKTCSGCDAPSYVSVQQVPSYSVCDSCSGPYYGSSYLPRQYCGGCLRRKCSRLVNNCNCGC